MPYLVAALLGSFLALNSFATPGRVERMARTELARRYPGAQIRVKVAAGRGLPIVNGQFDRIDVEVSHFVLLKASARPAVFSGAPSGQAGGPGASQSGDLSVLLVPHADEIGRVGHATVQLHDFSVEGLAIEETDLDVDDMAFDWARLKSQRQFALVSTGPVMARVAIPAATLLQYLAPRLRGVRDTQISLRDNQFVLSGKAVLPWLNWGVPFTLKSQLGVRDGNEIWLRDPRLGLSDVWPYGVPVGRLLAAINPVYAFDRSHHWPMRVMVSNIDLQDDRMTVTAGLRLAPVGHS